MQSLSFNILPSTDFSSLLDKITHFARQIKCNEDDIASIATISSEIAYNIAKYGTEGNLKLSLQNNTVTIFGTDNGGGIKSGMKRAFTDGFSQSNSLGLGLGSIVRLSDDVEIDNSSRGLTITVLKYLS